MTEQRIKDRLMEFIHHEGLTLRTFAARCSVRSSFLSGIENYIRADILTSISYYFPNLNIVWLLTGNGDMIREKLVEQDSYLAKPSETNRASDVIRDLIDVNLSLSFAFNSILNSYCIFRAQALGNPTVVNDIDSKRIEKNKAP